MHDEALSDIVEDGFCNVKHLLLVDFVHIFLVLIIVVLVLLLIFGISGSSWNLLLCLLSRSFDLLIIGLVLIID